MQRIVPALAILLGVCTLGLAGEAAVEPNAARSVHLHWLGAEADAFYNEVRILETTTNTYFCVCGFNHGYFGLQDFGGAKPRVAIFSVWDPGGQNDPSQVSAEQRVKMIFKDPAVRVRRFDGEGTGGQSFLDFDWKTNTTYRLLVRAKLESPYTDYEGYIYDEAGRSWRHLVTFRTLAHGDAVKGCYSFVEDFRRDGASSHERRLAEFGHGWFHTKDGRWVEAARARFTGDSTPLKNIDAGPATTPGWFFLGTGGSVTNQTTILGGETRREPTPEIPAPLKDFSGL